MIVKMKKAVIIMQAKDAAGSMQALRELGVMHVTHQQTPKSKDINAVREDLGLVGQALEVLLEGEFTTSCEGTLPRRDIMGWKASCQHIVGIWKRLDQLQEFSKGMALKIAEWKPWGDFSPEMVRRLADNGVYVKLYQVNNKDLAKFPEGVIVKKIFSKENIVFCAAISRQKFECPFKEIEIPAMGIGQMQRRMDEDRRIIESLTDDLRSFFCYHPELVKVKKSLEKELEFQEVLGGMGGDGGLHYAVGFVPVDVEKPLVERAQKEKWGILLTEPAGDDTVPTYIRNPRWVSIIRPVFTLIDQVPGYREVDISTLFLIFFSLFFSMIIGDAGYGIVYFILTLLAQKKFGAKVKNKSIFFLCYVLSSGAILWGMLTGTFFGQEWLVKSGIKPLVPVLNKMEFAQAFCFFLGILHLSIAHFRQAILKFPSLSALSDIGWLGILWAGFFLAKNLILGDAFPAFGKWLIIFGIASVVFFSNPQKNILKMIGSGFGIIALNLVNSFTDIVSYIRLFAVGLAGIVIADTVNVLARGFGGNIIAFVVIVLLGHALNIVLGPISVMVHGLRLNVLEFSSHAGVTWSGTAYRPFSDDNKGV